MQEEFPAVELNQCVQNCPYSYIGEHLCDYASAGSLSKGWLSNMGLGRFMFLTSKNSKTCSAGKYSQCNYFCGHFSLLTLPLFIHYALWVFTKVINASQCINTSVAPCNSNHVCVCINRRVKQASQIAPVHYMEPSPLSLAEGLQ